MIKSARRPRSLGDAEWEVIKVLWDSGPLATGEIYAALAERMAGRWAYSTVKTLIRRLVAKGWIEYQKVGNSFLYRAAVPRGKAVRSAVREFSDRVLDGLLSPFVAHYAEEKGLSEAEIAEIEQVIRRYRAKGGR